MEEMKHKNILNLTQQIDLIIFFNIVFNLIIDKSKLKTQVVFNTFVCKIQYYLCIFICT